jgi:hypothetical protein
MIARKAVVSTTCPEQTSYATALLKCEMMYAATLLSLNEDRNFLYCFRWQHSIDQKESWIGFLPCGRCFARARFSILAHQKAVAAVSCVLLGSCSHCANTSLLLAHNLTADPARRTPS